MLPQLRPVVIRLHYAWIIAGVTFVALIVTAGLRATPGVLIVRSKTNSVVPRDNLVRVGINMCSTA